MALALSILCIAFAASCIWLTVRIVNRKERWAKWTLAVVVGLPVLYVASFGPACWFSESIEPKWGQGSAHVYKGRPVPNMRVKVVPPAFTPLAWAARRGPIPLFLAVRWYATLQNDFVFCGVEDWGGGPTDGMLFTPP